MEGRQLCAAEVAKVEKVLTDPRMIIGIGVPTKDVRLRARDPFLESVASPVPESVQNFKQPVLQILMKPYQILLKSKPSINPYQP